MVDAWYSEIEHYDFDNPAPCPAAGHFTQLVWKDSVEIGCAMCRMDGGGWASFVFLMELRDWFSFVHHCS